VRLTMTAQFPIPFAKMSGTGNDFVIIDHRQPLLSDEEIQGFVQSVCRRRFSVGADGLILIETATGFDFRWRFYNADGSEAEMCGNGARCAARFAYLKGIAPPRMRFATGAGTIEAEITGAGVKIRLTRPTDIRLDLRLMLAQQERTVHSINTGVPHAVAIVNDLASCPVTDWGRELRFHPAFQPAGTNADFIRIDNRHAIGVRTYERGVEDETMACGTGAVAAALIAALTEAVDSPTAVTTSGGQQLLVHFSLQGSTIENVFLEGAAGLIYEGELGPDALL